MKNNLPLIFSLVAAFICFAVATLAVAYPDFQNRISDPVFWIFLVGVGCLLFAFVSKLKIGSLIEVERLERTVKQLIRCEVLRSPRGEYFYIDAEEKLFTVPDSQTIEFLSTSRGPIRMSDSEISQYDRHGEIESVLKCRILKEKEGGHLFAVLNGKKYYIGSWSQVFDWKRTKDSFDEVDAASIGAIPTGR